MTKRRANLPEAPRGKTQHARARDDHRASHQSKASDVDRSPFLKIRLRVNPPNDQYERQADRMADQVMSALPPSPHWKPAKPADETTRVGSAEDKAHQVSPAIEARTRGLLQTGGQPLPTNIRAFMEERFDHDFSNVHIHTGSEEARLAQSLNATAFTIGEHIAFDHGCFNPDSFAGRRLVAHELTHTIQQESSQLREVRPIQRKSCDPLAPDCPTGSACFPVGDTFECLKTDEGAFATIVGRILGTKGASLDKADEAALKELVESDPAPDRLKRFEKIIILWPQFGAVGKKAHILEIVTSPLRGTDAEESRRGRFSEEEGGQIKEELDQAVAARIEREKAKILKKDKTKTEKEAFEAAKDKELNSCLEFLEISSLPRLYADEEVDREAAASSYREGAGKRGKGKSHGAVLSRLASELRLRGLVGPPHTLNWVGSHERGHHEPNPVDLFDRLSSAGDGWYFFFVNLFSFHTFLIAVHVSMGGTRRRFFEIQGGQSVQKSTKELEEWFGTHFDPTNFNPKHTRKVGSRVWQIYVNPTD